MNLLKHEKIKTKNKKDIRNIFRPKEETDENTIKDL